MPYQNWTTQMQELTNGSLFTAVDTQMNDTMGQFWYVALFLTPVIMVYIKTESLGFATFVLCMTLGLYGAIVNPGGFISDSSSVIMAAGIASLILKILWDR
jgi:hypothetical protein